MLSVQHIASPWQYQSLNKGGVLKEELLMNTAASFAPQHVASSKGGLKEGGGW